MEAIFDFLKCSKNGIEFYRYIGPTYYVGTYHLGTECVPTYTAGLLEMSACGSAGSAIAAFMFFASSRSSSLLSLAVGCQ
eukprot:scaffold2244_cov105-Skeletonema_dohrnii-CCMP3373.AAC.4